MRQGECQVGGRGEVSAFLRPLYQANGVAAGQIVQPRVFPFLRRGEAVEVEVVQGKAGQGVGFDDGVGRAFDRAFKTGVWETDMSA